MKNEEDAKQQEKVSIKEKLKRRMREKKEKEMQAEPAPVVSEPEPETEEPEPVAPPPPKELKSTPKRSVIKKRRRIATPKRQNRWGNRAFDEEEARLLKELLFKYTGRNEEEED